jgi:hypothetical protein
MTCQWYNCKNSQDLRKIDDFNVCSFHENGGLFGTGDLFEQYAIIEEDFVNILKYIPLDRDNFNIFSPRFSDILIRSCVSIEIFFREWLNHYSFTSNEKIEKIRIKKKLTINDFYNAFGDIMKQRSIYVRQLNCELYPFQDWTENKALNWWDTYNQIKHNKASKQNNANLESGLNALAGLFLLHCEQIDSLKYLYKYSSTSLITVQWVRLKYIKTPLEAKRYLFLYRIKQTSPAHKIK